MKGRDYIGLPGRVEESAGNPARLRKLRSIALARVAMARLIGWVAMEQSFQRDADRAAQLLGAKA